MRTSSTGVLIPSLVIRIIKGSILHTDFSDRCDGIQHRWPGRCPMGHVMKLEAEGAPRGFQRSSGGRSADGPWTPDTFLLLVTHFPTKLGVVVEKRLPSQQPPFQPPLQLSVSHEQSFCLWNTDGGDACGCRGTNLRRNAYPPLPVLHSPLFGKW